MFYFPMLNTPQGIIAVGGYDATNTKRTKDILWLKCTSNAEDFPENCHWQKHEAELKVARSSHSIIPLPNNLDTSRICQCSKDEHEECIGCQPGFGKWSDDKIVCHACQCDVIGTESCTKSSAGDSCECKMGHTGQKCDSCDSGFWRTSESEVCKPCQCNEARAKSCNPDTGHCDCYPTYSGQQCDKCADDFKVLRLFAYQPGFGCESQPSKS